MALLLFVREQIGQSLAAALAARAVVPREIYGRQVISLESEAFATPDVGAARTAQSMQRLSLAERRQESFCLC